jgi:hypothetical protein
MPRPTTYPAILSALRARGARPVRRFTEDVTAPDAPATVEGWRVGEDLVLVLVGAATAEVYYPAGSWRGRDAETQWK